ncbi:MAG: hypothetical protein ACPGQD_01290, partial [Planctomycetota bacterium]
NDYPTEARVGTDGVYYYRQYAQGFGGQFAPAVIVDLGPATGLRLRLSDDLVGIWGPAAQSRPCTVWLVNPVTASAEAIYTGVVEMHGGFASVHVPHYLGQPTPSTTGSDYLVQVHGLTINHDYPTTDLAATVDANGDAVYVILGTFDSAAGTFDYSTQNAVRTLQDSANIADLDKALRAGVHIGSYEQTRDWNDPSNVTMNDAGDPITFTFGDPFSGLSNGYVYAAPGVTSGGRRRMAEAFSSLVCSFPKSAASDTYYIVAVVEWTGGDYEARLDYVSDGDLVAGAARLVVPVYTFDFDTGTDTVSNQAAVDLTSYRGIADASLIDSTVGANALMVSEFVGNLESVGRYGFFVRALAQAGPPWGPTRLLGATRDQSSSTDTQRLEVMPTAGTGSMTDEAATLRLGGPADFDIRATDVAGAKTLEVLLNGTAVVTESPTGGKAVGTTRRLIVSDLHLGPASGKLQWYVGPMMSGHPESSWSYNRAANAWDNDGSNGDYLYLPLPHLPITTGEAAEIVTARVYAGSNVGGSGGTEDLTVELVRFTMGGSETVEDTETVDVSGGAVAGAWITTQPSPSADIVAGDTWHLRVNKAGAGTAQLRVWGYEYQVRIFQIS